MLFFDTHLHLFDRARFAYDWSADLPALATGAFTVEEWRAEAGGRIDGALFMEVDVGAAYRDEGRHFAAMARAGAISGVIAGCRPEDDAGFEAWLDEARALGIKGFRRVLHVVPDAVSQSDTFRANVRRIGAAGLTFDIVVLARQLPLAAELARACPGTRFVLDHCGVPDIAGGGFEGWRAGIAALAGLPNVTCKLSGISAYCAPGTASAETLRPWVAAVLDSFGPARMVWGSDWPVVRLGAGLVAWLDASEALLAELSPAEAAAIARDNARALWFGG